MKASDKEEYLINIDRFLISDITDKPMLFEVFTNNENESDALKQMNTLISETSSKIEQSIKKIIPAPVKNVLRKVVK